MFLEVENVVKQYDGHLALDQVSLTVPENTIYGLLGPNGAGKTTLIRIINCITAPDSGLVRLNGELLTAKHIAHIGYLPEERGLYKKMKVGEQALYLAQLKGMSKRDAKQELQLWFEKFDILAWWDKKVEELSKGMAQKVQFITTVLHKPSLLIFDEPFSGFDPVNAELLKQEILHLRNNGATVIFSTHNMQSVEELCENISLVNKSKIVLQGNVTTIRASHATNTYLIRSKQVLQTSTNFEILEQRSLNQGFEAVVRKQSVQTNNELITAVLNQVELISFEEILPSMNDIFIKTVQ